MPEFHDARFSSQPQASESEHHRMRDWAGETIEEQPLSAMCAAFAAGFVIGAGAVTAYCLAESQARTRRMDHFGDRIADAVSRAMPGRLSDWVSR